MLVKWHINKNKLESNDLNLKINFKKTKQAEQREFSQGQNSFNLLQDVPLLEPHVEEIPGKCSFVLCAHKDKGGPCRTDSQLASGAMPDCPNAVTEHNLRTTPRSLTGKNDKLDS